MINTVLADKDSLCAAARSVIEIEQAAIGSLSSRIDEAFVSACEQCLACKGRVIVLGMGKSGHIARKIAATLASTGTPAFFVHPAEAAHGDMGMITRQDLILAISNSGRTDEILILLPFIKQQGLPLIAMTGSPHSILAKAAAVHLDVSIAEEACPLGLAPTASTTAALAMGDALAVALLKARGFTAEDFALSHPSGTLGRRLLLHVSDVMISGKAVPIVKEEDLLTDALVEINEKRLGMTVILNDTAEVAGIYTDGDLRRTLAKTADLRGLRIKDVMTKQFKKTSSTALAVDALSLMQEYKITSLVVIDNHHFCGILHMHKLLEAGIV
ncbi:MAG: KpsF/GutQ family sugar-phosphate isomerase [Gammaproteobacteria bacterium]|nr:KpsF/GutQ family sugar-phosphate isomerase [Gammaproteobacteria bacterium]